MEAASPRTTEGHTEEEGVGRSGSTTKPFLDGEAESSDVVRELSTEEILARYSKPSATSTPDSRWVTADEYFRLRSYPEGPVDIEDSRQSNWSSKRDALHNKALPRTFTSSASAEAEPAKLPATGHIRSASSARHAPALQVENETEVAAGVIGFDAGTASRTVTDTPSAPAIENIGQLRPSIVFKLKDGDIFQQDSATPPRLLERALLKMLHVLAHELHEPCCHLLTTFQTVLIVLQEVPDIAHTTPKWVMTHLVTHYLLIAIFAVYTADVAVRIVITFGIVSGKISSSHPTSSQNPIWRTSLYEGIRAYLKSLFSEFEDEVAADMMGKSRKRSIWEACTDIFSATTRRKQLFHDRRESIMLCGIHGQMHILFDVMTVMAFWISIALEDHGPRRNSAASVFRMISSLRILTLLRVSQGTQIVLRQLKAGIPQSIDVLLLICMFWILSAILGVQTFMSELRRSCIWLDPSAAHFNSTNVPVGFGQSCGGWLDTNGSAQPWQYSDGRVAGYEPKGYLCPQQLVCVEENNPFNGTMSFDDLGHSLELAFVVMSSSSFSNVMYHIIDSNSLASALYFVVVLVVMRLWLINVLISIVTSTFVALGDLAKLRNKPKFALTANELGRQAAPNQSGLPVLKAIYKKTYWFWILVIFYGFICQCLRSAGTSRDKARFLQNSEFVVSLLLSTEIAIRLCTNWTHFHKHKQNIADLIIALVTTAITIPGIGLSDIAYASLSVFQVLRIYRLVIAVPVARRYTELLLHSARDIISLVAFLLMLNFFVALLACQLFRGILPSSISDGVYNITFSNPLNSFIGIYQILSTDLWSNILFDLTASGKASAAGILGPIFLMIWFMSAQYILIAFIAVFLGRLDISEEAKYTLQFRKFLINDEPKTWSFGGFSLSKVLDMDRLSNQRRVPLDYGPATLEMLLNDAIVQQSLGKLDAAEGRIDYRASSRFVEEPKTWWKRYSYKVTRPLGRMFDSFRFREPNPFHSQLLQTSKAIDDLDAELTQSVGLNILEMHDTFLDRDEGGKGPSTLAVEREVALAAQRRSRAQEEYLLKHPHYDRSLYMFSQNSRIRKFCQLLVPAGRGERIYSRTGPKSKYIHPIFGAFIDITVLAMVIDICIATPLYQRNTFPDYPHASWNWVSYTNLAFALIFSIEALIRTIADGLYWTPNTYWPSLMGFVDSIVIVALWVDLIDSQVSHQIAGLGALKALRAFRLCFQIKAARSLVLAVLGRSSGLLMILISAVVLLMAFGAYGLTLFGGKLDQCNDVNASFNNTVNCVGEYSIQEQPGWNVLSPGVVITSYINFDNFGNAIFTLFQIMSRRGFADVMVKASSIQGSAASQLYSLYFIAFNLVTTIFVLILLLSTFTRNATETTGQALLTSDQKSWAGLRTILDAAHPTKRGYSHWESKIKVWCFRRAVRKRGRWYRFITSVLVVHILLLCLQLGPGYERWNRARDYIFLAILSIYSVQLCAEIVGLTWMRFRKSLWGRYFLGIVSFTIITGIIAQFRYVFPYTFIYHLGLDAIALLIIPRIDRLSRAWTAAMRSLLPLTTILLVWAVCFVIFAIAFTSILGLAPFSASQTWEMNFRSVPNSLVFLFMLSYGDEWPQLMNSVASVTSDHCLNNDGQCVNPTSVRALFTIWNILSMYFFANACTAIVYSHTPVGNALVTSKAAISAVSREDMRRFKIAWASLDPDGTGYVSREMFPRMLGELSGIFEMRIYDGEWTVRRILEKCQLDLRDPRSFRSLQLMPGVDLAKLNRALSKLPVREIQKRRAKMDLFYSEVLMDADPDRGIAFVNLLRILAQYNVLKDQNGLQLEESLQRRARLRKVEEQRMRIRVASFVDTLYWRRMFMKHMARKQGEINGRSLQPFAFSVTEDAEDGRASNNYTEGFDDYLTVNRRSRGS